ncbi:MAG: hypothetical protein ACM30H_00210 [Clostridia bacterium]
MKSFSVFLVFFAVSQFAVASGGSGSGGGGGSGSGKRTDDALKTVTFPTTNITSVIDDSRVRAATIPVFAVPAIAPIAAPALAVPTVTLPFANLKHGRTRGGADGVLETRQQVSENEVRGSLAEGETEISGGGSGSGLDGPKGYDLNVQLPMANPFAPWKTDQFNLVPACN